MQQILYRSIEPERPTYFIGIGGIGMSGLAQLLFKNGYKVMGSDIKETSMTKKLRSYGMPVFIGHNSDQIPPNAQVIYSSAIKKGNPELDCSIARSLPLLKRGKVLSLVMEGYYGIAVSGSHGKTTISSMIAKILENSGLSPVSIIGGIVNSTGTNLMAGDGKYLVAEADESDGSFNFLRPKLAVVSNIDFEHIDHYGSYDNLLCQFRKFLTESAGKSVVNSDDEGIKAILSSSMVKVGQDGDYRIEDAYLSLKGASFKLRCKDGALLEIALSVIGMHNITDASLAAAAAKELGVGNEVIVDSLSRFDGVKRRMMRIGEIRDVLIMDDYGHHPTEIAATLRALKIYCRRIVVLFQPHRFTRTKLLFDKFSKSFENADRVYVTDIYAAGEQTISGVTGRALAENINHTVECSYIGTLAEAIPKIVDLLEPGDLLLTMGAGDIGSAASQILNNLKGAAINP